jgi:hypothetical protein
VKNATCTSFTYKGKDFDDSGIMYHLGTRGGTVNWTNPADAGLVKVTCR